MLTVVNAFSNVKVHWVSLRMSLWSSLESATESTYDSVCVICKKQIQLIKPDLATSNAYLTCKALLLLLHSAAFGY